MKYILLVSLVAFSQLLRAQTVSVDTFASQLKGAQQPQLIDVRTPEEFSEGHLPSAVNIDSKREDFSQALSQLDKNKPVFVYCLSGGRSKRAFDKLHELGYTDVRDLQGGYLKWTSRMMPVEGVTQSKEGPEWTVDRLNNLIHSQPVVLVDVFATWCIPCKKMAPIIDKLSKEMAGRVTVVKLNADTEKPLLTAYQVDELPTLLLFRNGKLVDRLIGVRDEAGLRAALQ